MNVSCFVHSCSTARGNDQIQLDLFLSYGSNPPLYPVEGVLPQVSTTDVNCVGKERQDFPAAGPEPYKRDLKTLDFHLLDAGHFALETNGDEIANLMRDFLGKTWPIIDISRLPELEQAHSQLSKSEARVCKRRSPATSPLPRR